MPPVVRGVAVVVAVLVALVSAELGPRAPTTAVTPATILDSIHGGGGLSNTTTATPAADVTPREQALQAACPAACTCDEGLEWSAECEGPGAGAVHSAVWRPGEYVKLTCGTGEPDAPPPALRVAALPRLLPPQRVPSAGFYWCGGEPEPRPPGTWQRALAALGVTHTEKLTLRGAPLEAVTAAALAGLEELTLLTVWQPQQAPGDAAWSPPRDLLRALPHLRRLTVRGARVALGPDAFPEAPRSLDTLEVAEGEVALAAGAFRGLASVRRLLLWRAGLRALPPGALEGLAGLEELELTGNLLVTLEAGALGGAPRLRTVHLAANPVAAVEAGALPSSLQTLELWRCSSPAGARLRLGAALGGLAALRVARLEYCALAPLADDALVGAVMLQNVSLASCSLDALPPSLLRDQRALERLDLSRNNIERIPSGIFSNLQSLLELNLDNNKITAIESGAFTGLSALRELSARACGLRAVAAAAMAPMVSLRALRLDRNLLALAADAAPDADLGPHSALRSLRALESLSLSHNRLTRVYTDWRLSLVLRELDLSHNAISYLSDADLNFLSSNIVVDFRFNNISTVELINLPPPSTARPGGGGGGGERQEEEQARAALLLDENPYECDCRLVGFVSLVRRGGGGGGAGGVDARHARCAGPPALAGSLLSGVAPAGLACALPAPPCPAACRCEVRPGAGLLQARCRTWRAAAALPAPRSLGLARTELRLLAAPADNDTAPLAVPPHVAVLDLSSLGLREAPALTPLAPGALLRLVDLRNNSLDAPPLDLLRAANTSQFRLLLAGNTLRCPCDTIALRLLNDTVEDWSRAACVEVSCGGGGGAVMGALAALALAVAAALGALLLRYEEEARAFLLARGCWVPARWRRGAADAAARYDAFVSYSHEDEPWVADLVRALEAPGGGGGALRLCVHERDWTPGEWIPKQIARSVQEARRTVLVVSPAWARSRWAQAEWRAAAAREALEGVPRVLVVLRADVPPAALPPALRAHLAARTYLPHTDPQLVRKLRAALQAPLPRAPPPPVPALRRGSLDADKEAARY